MLDSRKNTLTKKSFSSDLENHIFRFATVEGIESLVIEASHKAGLLNVATVTRLKAGKTNIEGMQAVRMALCKALAGECLTLEKKNFQDLEVEFEWLDDTLIMTAERTKTIFSYGFMKEPQKYLRFFNDYQIAMVFNEETENDEDFEE